MKPDETNLNAASNANTMDSFLFVRGPLNGQRHPIPRKAQHLDCCMQIGRELVIYKLRKRGKKPIFVYSHSQPILGDVAVAEPRG